MRNKALPSKLIFISIFTFSILFLCIFVSISNASDHTYTIIKVGSSKNIVIDGQLDEHIWQTINPITDFTQMEPFEGTPISERTEAYVFYDDEHIYFGFKCYDSEPEKIIARVDRRDARTNSDEVIILIDTYHDLRNGFLFSVNAAGVQSDACICESSRGEGRRRRGWEIEILDLNWNGIWRSGTKIFSNGWTAEIAIPFKSLRFTPEDIQTWGFNLQRNIARKNEAANWYPVKRFDRIMKPSKAGQLVGLENIKPGRNLQLIPFTLAKGQKSSLEQVKDTPFSPSLGLNIKYGITANLTADIAINPDFGQTEVDEENVRLSKFEIFYPEKREFFMEGADIFNTPLQLFFSRRIGRMFPDYSEHNILFGGKITGKLSKYRIGIIESFCRETSYYNPDDEVTYDIAQTNFFVFRMQRDILKKSSIGFITVNRDQKIDDEFWPQRVHGIDLNLAFGNHLQIFSQFAFSSNVEEGKPIENSAFISGLSYDSNVLEFSIGARNIGEYFDVSQVGYFPRTDRLGGDISVAYKPYIYRLGIRQFTFRTEASYYDNHDGLIEDQRLQFTFGQFWENFWYSGVSIEAEKERYYEFFQGTELEEETVYSMNSIRFYVFSSENRPIILRCFISFGDFIDYSDYFFGKRRSYSVNVDTKPTSKLQWSFRVNIIQDLYTDGTLQENRGLLLTRIGYAFNNKLRFRALSQYNLHSAQLITDSLIAYDFNALSGLYFGIRDRRNLQFRDDAEPEDLRFFFKISFLLAF
jgi:hypothetical protein